jgi:hypothetical protein
MSSGVVRRPARGYAELYHEDGPAVDGGDGF